MYRLLATHVVRATRHSLSLSQSAKDVNCLVISSRRDPKSSYVKMHNTHTHTKHSGCRTTMALSDIQLRASRERIIKGDPVGKRILFSNTHTHAALQWLFDGLSILGESAFYNMPFVIV